MKKSTVIAIGVLCFVVGLVVGRLLPKAAEMAVGSATNCTDGYSCFTNLEVQGNLITDGTMTGVGALTLSSTLSVAATTTLSDTVNFNNSAICINFYATSTDTRVHLTASTTGTLPAGAAGVMTFDYGACAN